MSVPIEYQYLKWLNGCKIGWLEKQKFPKNNFRHADPGVCHTKKDNYLSYISFESNG